MSERRFNEAEVAAIFERAAEAQQVRQQQLPSSEGMTLIDLQDIGREVGISTDELAKAAKAIELSGRPTSRSFLGLPVGVGLTIDLARTLSDEEWERLVVDLRETFDARGTLKSEGSLRQWANGNLQALLEPTATGHRLRLRTVKGDARGLIVGGLVIVGFATAALIAPTLDAAAAGAGSVTGLAILAAWGASMSAFGAFRLPAWARLRRRQMEDVAARAAIVASSPPANVRHNES
jgi:hypothetical protein